MDFDTLHFFELQKHPDALPLYEALETRILAEIPDVRIKVQKSQITFYNKHLFACEPYPGRWTHHIVVSGLEEIDDELMGWVKEAAAFAAAK